MKSEIRQVSIEELTQGYKDSQEEGVVALGGRLNVRPPYQREFVYDDKDKNLVIETIFDELPLGLFYWAENDDGSFEVLDGQQRTLSICQYLNNDFSFRHRMFSNLTDEERVKVLSHRLLVSIFRGTQLEKLDWFERINIVGKKLTKQELRNAAFTGPWLADAKLKFSKPSCAAYLLANEKGPLLTGELKRQDYLETALNWRSGGDIEEYMGAYQGHPNANELWQYFQSAIAWVRIHFPKYRPQMKTVDWGLLYNNFGSKKFDASELEKAIASLMVDDEVQKKTGIYPYVLTGDEKYLNVRAFTESQKAAAYERQGGVCIKCGQHFSPEEMEADHIKPWHEGGKTTPENCQMLCKHDNRTKSGK